MDHYFKNCDIMLKHILIIAFQISNAFCDNPD